MQIWIFYQQQMVSIFRLFTQILGFFLLCHNFRWPLFWILNLPMFTFCFWRQLTNCSRCENENVVFVLIDNKKSADRFPLVLLSGYISPTTVRIFRLFIWISFLEGSLSQNEVSKESNKKANNLLVPFKANISHESSYFCVKLQWLKNCPKNGRLKNWFFGGWRSRECWLKSKSVHSTEGFGCSEVNLTPFSSPMGKI